MATVIQTQTPISYGSSGGPLINRWGRIIGLISNSRGDPGFNFAIAAHPLGEPPTGVRRRREGARVCATYFCGVNCLGQHPSVGVRENAVVADDPCSVLFDDVGNVFLVEPEPYIKRADKLIGYQPWRPRRGYPHRNLMGGRWRLF